MKFPNFRLYETQANASLVLGVVGLIGLGMLAFVVFKNFNAQHMTVPYNPSAGLGVFRKPLVYGGTAIELLVGGTAAILGFNSLGQRRNPRQGRSWLGMTLGALVVAGAPILFFAWRKLSEPIIQTAGG